MSSRLPNNDETAYSLAVRARILAGAHLSSEANGKLRPWAESRRRQRSRVFPVSPFEKTLTDQLILTLVTNQFVGLTWITNRILPGLSLPTRAPITNQNN